jgi:hypothetical protein
MCFVPSETHVEIWSSRAGGVAQAVEHLPSKCEALSSSPSTAKVNK